MSSPAHCRFFGANAIDVSIHDPQLHPPPASGESNNPCAGMVLSQQSGRSRFQLEVAPLSASQTVTLPLRKKSAFEVAA